MPSSDISRFEDSCESNEITAELLSAKSANSEAIRESSVRSVDQHNSHPGDKTHCGEGLNVECSNVEQCDPTLTDILLVDQQGNRIGRPWLTTVVDVYSRCIVGFQLRA